MAQKQRLRNAVVPRVAAADAVTVLTFFIILLFGIPGQLIFGPLGGAGSPAQLLGMVALLWWAGYQLSRRHIPPPLRQPIRRALLVFVAAVLASYVVATVRPISDVELLAADRGLLSLSAWLGIVFVAADGIPSRARLDTLLRRLVVAGGAVALLGIAQFKTGASYTNFIQIPGLSQNSDLTSVIGRSGFSRPAGTALHPIEFGIVLTMILPIAIHFAISDRDRSVVRRWFPVLALALAVPISISRSAIVCTTVVLAFLIPSWARPLRRRAYAAITVLLGLVFVAVPGILGTLVGLFSGISSDSSAQSRTGSYTLAWEYISRAPLFGRGFQTFLPAYHILDNEYLLATIEIGFVGLATLLALFITGVTTAWRSRKLSSDPTTRQLAQALAASVAAGGASFALFDALSFGQLTNLIMLVLGAIGALYRLQVAGNSWPDPQRARSRWAARPTASRQRPVPAGSSRSPGVLVVDSRRWAASAMPVTPEHSSCANEA